MDKKSLIGLEFNSSYFNYLHLPATCTCLPPACLQAGSRTKQKKNINYDNKQIKVRWELATKQHKLPEEAKEAAAKKLAIANDTTTKVVVSQFYFAITKNSIYKDFQLLQQEKQK